jgi:para-aminobenzoate synthetase component 1
MLLDSNRTAQAQNDPFGQYDLLLAFGVDEQVAAGEQPFERLQERLAATDDWWFGHFSYELKDRIEKLSSGHPDPIGFPELFFFRPRTVFAVRGQDAWLEVPTLMEESAAEAIVQRLLDAETEESTAHTVATLSPVVSPEAYTRAFDSLQQHIARGDIYEVNYCVAFEGVAERFEPIGTYLGLTGLSPMPFSAFYRENDHYLLCASPERFLCKRGRQLHSQPIKGTARRSEDPAEDQRIRQVLAEDPKEQSENVMIVDLVRNDLSRHAAKGSVRVDELFGVHTFRNLHQLISTVTAELREGHSAVEALRDCFPMGSMTGAPKIRAMELIESHENRRRGLYSGALGYFAPGGDFDFNVVIRSIQYNAANRQVSFSVGSAITAKAEAKREYAECLLKAESMLKAVGSKQ